MFTKIYSNLYDVTVEWNNTLESSTVYFRPYWQTKMNSFISYLSI